MAEGVAVGLSAAVEVAVACGFSSAAYFSRAYRAQFGRAPRADRKALQASGLRTGGLAAGA